VMQTGQAISRTASRPAGTLSSSAETPCHPVRASSRPYLELGFKPKEASKIWLDNQSALAVAKNPELHSRTKHIDIRHHFIRDCVENDVIEVHYCPTKQMIADILTKALPKHQFQELRAQLGVCG